MRDATLQLYEWFDSIVVHERLCGWIARFASASLFVVAPARDRLSREAVRSGMVLPAWLVWSAERMLRTPTVPAPAVEAPA